MKPPIHQNPSREDRTASAPYNFVPLPEVVVPAVKDPDNELPDQDRFHTNRKTGYFEVELTAKAPLYVRCALTLPEFLRSESEEEKKLPFQQRAKNTPDFFYTHDPKQPVIPGSSLRGMLRNLLEVASYGKIADVMKSPKIFFRAVAAEADDPLKQPYVDVIGNMAKNVRAGYLVRERDGWAIRPACNLKILLWTGDENWQEKSKVWRQRVNFFKIKEEEIPTDAISGLIRLSDPRYKPQYHKTSFEITQFTRRMRIRGQERTFDEPRLAKIGPLDASLPNRGELVCSGNMLETGDENQESPRKTFVIVPKADTAANTKKIKPQAVQDYLDALTDFQKDDPFDKQMGMLIDGRPVFYVDEPDDEIFYFGHSPNFRIPAVLHTERRAATPNDFVPDYCKEVKTLDLTEAIFGHAKGPDSGAKPGDKAYAYASRVFVTDAKMIEGQSDIWLSNEKEAIVPRILASPKPTAFQHYLVQQNSNNSRQLYHYGSKTPQLTSIRGFKYYWRQGKAGGLSEHEWKQSIAENDADAFKKLRENPKDDTQHTQFRPVKPDTKFTFRVYFENLSELELGAMCWVLQPLPHPDLSKQGKEICHHLGMGKPLGMGSVKLDAKLIFTDRGTRYKALFDDAGWESGVRKTNGKIVFESVDDYRTKFEQEVLTKLQLHPKYQHLYDLKRIAMLLKLMEWPGYPPVLEAKQDNRVLYDLQRPNTRYMTISLPDLERKHANEYKERPVLPDPEAFGGLLGEKAVPEGGLSQSTSSGTSSLSKPSAPKPPAPKSAEPKNVKPKPRQSRQNAAQTTPSSPDNSPASARSGSSGVEKVWVTVVKLLSGARAQVTTAQGDEVPCTGLPNYPVPQVGQRFRANIFFEKGKAIRAMFKGWT